ncbi:uncharacterized protein Naga_100020g60 [Nannochloropsis gaditana]|uniref:PinX1-related protein 1 n=1 Tax=Nannochloropsis gaditana TaxID=72520 RepID=W7TL94_9STRA|nr:uncharacterized protein Naga_100020g60 [Nannochloropsis gaditana]
MAKRTENTAAVHLKSLVGPMQDTLNQHWVDGKKKNFGFKMMMKMGWSDGQGLGKELQGCATHVTVAKKVDSAGLGSVRDETGNAGWTEASATFDSVLSKLNETYKRQEVPLKRKKKRARGEKLPVVPIKVARPRCCCGIPSFCKAKILKSMVQKTCKLFSASGARMVSPNLLRKLAHLDPLFGQPWPDQQLDAPQRERWV